MLKWVSFFALMAICSCAMMDEAQDTENMAFNYDGFEHHESRKVESKTVVLTDEIDGFLVALDYERDILMIKNLTSQTCFFSRLEYIPIAENETIPVLVQEVTNGTILMNAEQETDVLLFSAAGQIPSGYVLLTNDVTVAAECSSQPSYWLEKVGATRTRRRCNWRCKLRLVVIGIGIGVATGIGILIG